MSKIEVYLNENQIENLKQILEQSKNGFHLLFEKDQINTVFKKDFDEDDFFSVDTLVKAQEDLIRLLQLRSVGAKKLFISSLNDERLERLIRTYFYIIENEIKSHKKLAH